MWLHCFSFQIIICNIQDNDEKTMSSKLVSSLAVILVALLAPSTSQLKVCYFTQVVLFKLKTIISNKLQ